MSKRRRRKKAPNIPKATLERARQQATGETPPDGGQDEERAEVAQPTPPTTVTTPEPEKRQRRRRVDDGPAQIRKRKQAEEPDAAMIEELLANPTKFVTEEELREEYGYVLTDLRSMGILAAALLAILVLIAQFL